MSWTNEDLIALAEMLGRDMTSAQKLALAWALIELVSDPRVFAALDMFLGMVSEHCDGVKLDAASKADLDANDELERGIPGVGFVDLDVARDHCLSRRVAMGVGFVDLDAARAHSRAARERRQLRDGGSSDTARSCSSSALTCPTSEKSFAFRAPSACPSTNPQTSSEKPSISRSPAATVDSASISTARTRSSSAVSRIFTSCISVLRGWFGFSTSDHRGIPAATCNSAGPNQGGGDAETQSTTTHEQSEPVPEPGPSAERVALAIVRDAVARSDDSWFFQTLGAVSLFVTIVICLFAGAVFK